MRSCIVVVDVAAITSNCMSQGVITAASSAKYASAASGCVHHAAADDMQERLAYLVDLLGPCHDCCAEEAAVPETLDDDIQEAVEVSSGVVKSRS